MILNWPHYRTRLSYFRLTCRLEKKKKRVGNNKRIADLATIVCFIGCNAYTCILCSIRRCSRSRRSMIFADDLVPVWCQGICKHADVGRRWLFFNIPVHTPAIAYNVPEPGINRSDTASSGLVQADGPIVWSFSSSDFTRVYDWPFVKGIHHR